MEEFFRGHPPLVLSVGPLPASICKGYPWALPAISEPVVQRGLKTKGDTMSEDFTVGDLRRHLQAYSDDDKLSFAGGLGFYRVKASGDNEAFIEFNEPQADMPPEFRKKNPHIKVAFINIDDVEQDESGMAKGPINVTVR